MCRQEQTIDLLERILRDFGDGTRSGKGEERIKNRNDQDLTKSKDGT